MTEETAVTYRAGEREQDQRMECLRLALMQNCGPDETLHQAKAFLKFVAGDEK